VRNEIRHFPDVATAASFISQLKEHVVEISWAYISVQQTLYLASQSGTDYE
jgi:hypothetical protein